MFCKNCGNEITLGVLFCPKCGARISEDVPQSEQSNTWQTVSNEPAVNSDFSQTSADIVDPAVSSNQAPISSEQNYGANYANNNTGANYGANYTSGQNSMAPVDANHELGVFGEVAHVGDAASPTKPKRKLKKILLTVCLPLILILALAVSVYANPVWRNSFLRMVMSDKAYFKYVMGNNIKDYVSDMSSDLSVLQDVLEGKSSVNAKFQVELGDDAKNLISKYGNPSVGLILSGIESAGFSADIGRNGEKYGFDIGLLVNDSAIINTESILAEDGFYLTAPGLNDSAAYIPVDENIDISLFSETLDKISQIFPSEKVIASLVTKYALCVVNNVSDITEKDITINAGGIKQEAIGMTVKLDGESLLKIAKACLTEAKNDKDIKNIIENVCKNGLVDEDFEESYKSFCNGIDELLEELEDAKDYPEFEDFEISARFIANNRGELIGFDINHEEVQLKVYNTQNSEKYGTLISIEANEFELSYESSGAAKGGKYNGEGSVNLSELGIIDVKLENVDIKKYDKGIFNGKITITPGDGAKSLMALAKMKSSDISEVMEYLKSMELVIESSATKEYSGNLIITALYNGVKFAGVKVEYGIGEQKKCDIPSSYATINNESDMAVWLETCIDNLSKLDNLPFALRMLALGR